MSPDPRITTADLDSANQSRAVCKCRAAVAGCPPADVPDTGLAVAAGTGPAAVADNFGAAAGTRAGTPADWVARRSAYRTPPAAPTAAVGAAAAARVRRGRRSHRNSHQAPGVRPARRP